MTLTFIKEKNENKDSKH